MADVHFERSELRKLLNVGAGPDFFLADLTYEREEARHAA